VLDQPLHWLALGFKDFSKSPWLSTLHGLVLAIWGAAITWLAHDRFWLLAGSLSGFLVIAPVLATSLYAMSRAMERNEKVDFKLLVNTWTQWHVRLRNEPDSYWSLIRFGLLLALAATGWVITSSALITLLAPVPIHTPLDFVRHVVLNNKHFLFEIWLGLGGLMAAPVFASSVISMPLLLDPSPAHGFLGLSDHGLQFVGYFFTFPGSDPDCSHVGTWQLARLSTVGRCIKHGRTHVWTR
jgi:uncharacterized membrane protein